MGAWTEIVDYTVPSNTTSVVLNDFGTITKDDFIKIVVTIINTNASFIEVSLLANSSITSNYHHQLIFGAGTSTGADRRNFSFFSSNSANKTGFAIGYLKLSENDRFNTFSNYISEIDSTLGNVFTYTTSSGATFASGITSLTFTASQTNAIGTGSRIQIYRLDAEKVADITTTANATQVDISSLSIGKDSEYLLVSDIVQGASADGMRLTVNDNTTSSTYHCQTIIGNGSSATAVRQNLPAIGSNINAVIYTHIKLSEIGAYTYQSYELRSSGTSTVQVLNHFGSSTAENLTSITKLNIITQGVTNGIGSGSRFILYKLK